MEPKMIETNTDGIEIRGIGNPERLMAKTAGSEIHTGCHGTLASNGASLALRRSCLASLFAWLRMQYSFRQ